eukprot:TRINITY_DN3916_c0_g1_i1.p1 TRINITY_DN3916_c0_g1~~TRINITY_DN3916_c0_g1_i1.p1  ORF type:complete len:325 (-),score=-0.81 TRINITY_DN3916_c0_g1_i1:163-1137(-)
MQFNTPIAPGRPYTKSLEHATSSMIVMGGPLNTGCSFFHDVILYPDKRLHPLSKAHGTFPAHTKEEASRATGFEFALLPSAPISTWPYCVPLQPCRPQPWMYLPHSDPTRTLSSPLPWSKKESTVDYKDVGAVFGSRACGKEKFISFPMATSHSLIRPQAHILESLPFQNNLPLKTSKGLPNINKLEAEGDDPFLNASYKYRNVFKAIIRRMHVCVRTRRRELESVLRNAGYSAVEVDRAFSRVAYYKNAERKSGKKRMSVRTIKEATRKRTIYTYILRDALNSMLEDWEVQKFGRLTERNVPTYKKVCATYLEDIDHLLAKQH